MKFDLSPDALGTYIVFLFLFLIVMAAILGITVYEIIQISCRIAA